MLRLILWLAPIVVIAMAYGNVININTIYFIGIATLGPALGLVLCGINLHNTVKREGRKAIIAGDSALFVLYLGWMSFVALVIIGFSTGRMQLIVG